MTEQEKHDEQEKLPAINRAHQNTAKAKRKKALERAMSIIRSQQRKHRKKGESQQ